MAHRRFQDDNGRWWDVWDTHPTIIDRRAGRDRRSGHRSHADRRTKTEPRVAVEPEYRDGWLAFQSGDEWRRLAPIPAEWETLPDADLRALLLKTGGGPARVNV